MTIEEAATIYARMLFPGALTTSTNYIAAETDFTNGAEWYEKQNLPVVKAIKFISEVCKATLLLIETKTP